MLMPANLTIKADELNMDSYMLPATVLQNGELRAVSTGTASDADSLYGMRTAETVILKIILQLPPQQTLLLPPRHQGQE